MNSEIKGMLYDFYTKAHHIYVRMYNKPIEALNNWFYSYSFPIDNLDDMKNLQEKWINIVYDEVSKQA